MKKLNIFKIAKSYIFSKNKTKLTRIHSYIATIGIIIGVTALIVVSSAMSGFSEYLYSRLNISYDVIIKMNPNTSENEVLKVKEELSLDSDVKSVAQFKMINNAKVFGHNINLYVLNDELAKKRNLKEDVLNVSNKFSNYLSKFNYVALDIYDENSKKVIQSEAEYGVDAEIQYDLLDQAILGVNELDQENISFWDVFITEKTLNDNMLVDLSDSESVILGVDLDSFFKTKKFDSYEKKESVELVFGWHKEREEMYQTLQLEQTVIKIVLFFIILVSCFNIVSTLTLIITEKKQDIFVLKTIGYSNNSVLSLFLLTGAWIGILGIILGTVFGVLITINLTEILHFLQNVLGFHFLPEGITTFPYKLNPKEIVNINLLTTFFIFVACLIPSLNTLSINPAEGLKDE